MIKDIPSGTKVSFIDPVSELPVTGVVELEFSEFLGVRYLGKYLPAAPGKPPRMLKGADGEMIAWINISKEKVFVVR
jgi:hypothetical protein